MGKTKELMTTTYGSERTRRKQRLKTQNQVLIGREHVCSLYERKLLVSPEDGVLIGLDTAYSQLRDRPPI